MMPKIAMKKWGIGVLGSAIALSVLINTHAQASTSGDRSPAPAFTLPALDKPISISLSDHKGKVIYLDFWASWCGPCQQSLPLLNGLRRQMQEKYGKDKFEVLAINLDQTSADGKAFLTRFPVDYPVLSDPNGKTPEKYQLTGMPTAYFIDHKGRVVGAHQGFKKSDMPAITQMAETLLKEASTSH